MNRRPFLLSGPWRAGALSGLIAVFGVLVGCSKPDPAALAREFIAKGDSAAAMVQLRAAVQANPESAELRVMLADLQERNFDLAGAQENLTKAIDAGGDANVLAPRLALIMLDRNELDALIRSNQANRLSDSAADSSLRGFVALAQFGLKRHEAGREQLQLAQASAPSVTLAKAQLLVIEGKPKEALALLDLDGGGKSAPWYVLRGGKRIAVEAGDTAKALAYMQRAVDAAPWHVGVKGELGEALVTAGRFDDARVIFDGLRKSNPGDFWTHYLGALLAQRERRFEEAHALTLRTLRVSPEHLPSQILAASSEIGKGDLLQAEKRLQALLKKNADSVAGWQLYAQVQARLGRPQEQAKAIKQGLQLAPGNPLLLSQQADMQMAAGQTKAAMATLQALMESRPQDADTMLKLAQVKFRSGDKAGASELVQKAGEAAGNDVQSATRAVFEALQLGNPALARKIADQVAARLPNEPLARLAVGAVQSAQNDAAGARATTLQVLDKHPAHDGALQALASMSRTKGQLKELLARYQAAVDASSRSPQTYLDYASLLRAKVADARATPQAVLEAGVNAVPTSVALRESLIAQLTRQGEHDKATSVAQTGATMANAPPGAAALLVAAYERTGKTQQATELLRKLVADNPQRTDWRLRMAQLEAGAGREAEALTQLRALVAERPFDSSAYQALAQLQAAKDAGAALATARKLGEQPGLKGAGHLLAGDVLAGAGRIDDALAEYELSAKSGSGTIAISRSVQLLDRSGKADAAERELQAAMRKYPDDPELLTRAVYRAQAKRDAPKALELLGALAARVPSNAYVLNDLAWAQLAAGRPEALVNARKAAALMPDQPKVLHTLGMALAKAGKAEEATEWLRAAANLAPQSQVPRLNLAQHQAASGDKIGAAQTLRSVTGEGLSTAEKESLGKLKAELGVS